MSLTDIFLFFLGVYIGQEYQDIPNINNVVKKIYDIAIEYKNK